MVGAFASDESGGVAEDRQDGRQAIRGALRRAGQSDHERPPPHADDLPREIGRREAVRGVGAHLLGEARNLEVEDRAHPFGSAVAGRDAGAAGQHDQVRAIVVGAGPYRAGDLVRSIRDRRPVHDPMRDPRAREGLLAGGAAPVGPGSGRDPVGNGQDRDAECHPANIDRSWRHSTGSAARSRNLRLSVTDRCNLRCSYCMPEEDYVWLPRKDILDFEEIGRLVDVFGEMGVDRIRLTGGEPLLRQDLPRLVRLLAAKPWLRDLA